MTDLYQLVSATIIEISSLIGFFVCYKPRYRLFMAALFLEHPLHFG